MVKYKVTYRFVNDKKEREKIVVASSSQSAERKVESDDIIIIDVREHLPGWGDSYIGRLIKWLFGLVFK